MTRCDRGRETGQGTMCPLGGKAKFRVQANSTAVDDVTRRMGHDAYHHAAHGLDWRGQPIQQDDVRDGRSLHGGDERDARPHRHGDEGFLHGGGVNVRGARPD